MNNRENAFDIIRHIAALMVLVSHHFILSGRPEPIVQGQTSLGSTAVLCFFAISGFLITQSFLNTTTFFRYMIKRVARIFPALIVCAFLMVYMLGSLFHDGGILAFLSSTDALRHFLSISAFGRADIDTVTHDFLFSESLNGSLWTLKLEFGLYIALALILSVLRKAAAPLLMLPFFCVIGVWAALSSHPLAAKLLIYINACIAFFIGSALYFYRDVFSRKQYALGMAVVAVALIFAPVESRLSGILVSIGFSVLTILTGFLCVDRLIRSRFDISYGIYIYAFPVQQLFINCTSLGFYSSMAASALVTILMATLSWKLIEEPALKYARRKLSGTKAQADHPQYSSLRK